MRRMSCVATGFKMDRQMNRQYMHRFIRRLRARLDTVQVKAQHLSIGRSGALTIGSSDGCI
jgi:hypothetical protein